MVELKTERELFEDLIFQAPRTAQLLHEAGRYTSRMGTQDREAFMRVAFDRFFDMRDKIRAEGNVRRFWVDALNQAGASRHVWKIWFTWHEYKWVQGAKWRGKDCYA
jgi:hypothetical protein